MKTKTKTLLFFLLSVCIFSCKPKQKDSNIEYLTFEVENGWGYDIKINQKTFIHQDVIPAINKSIPFNSKEDAEKVAKLIIEKIKKKEMPPAVSKKEIHQLGINTDS